MGRVHSAQRLVLWVAERLLEALGQRGLAREQGHDERATEQTAHALQLLNDVKRFADTITDEITEEGQ